MQITQISLLVKNNSNNLVGSDIQQLGLKPNESSKNQKLANTFNPMIGKYFYGLAYPYPRVSFAIKKYFQC